MKAWIARDRDNTLCVYYNKPIKGKYEWFDSVLFSNWDIDIDLPEGVNPQWSDDEPIEVELKIESVKQ